MPTKVAKAKRASSKLKEGKLTDNVVRANGGWINTVTGLRTDENGIPLSNQKPKSTMIQRQIDPVKAEKRRERLEECRMLMTLSMSTGDIERHLTEKWQVSRRYVRIFMSMARKMQQEILQRKPEECFSDSLSYWSQKLQQAFSRYRQGIQDLSAARQAANTADAAMKKALELGDAKLIISCQKHLSSCERRIGQARLLIHGASNAADSYQDRIDRLCGNLAPERIALVTAAGQDVLPAAMLREPLNNADAKLALVLAMRQQFPHLTDDDIDRMKLPKHTALIPVLESTVTTPESDPNVIDSTTVSSQSSSNGSNGHSLDIPVPKPVEPHLGNGNGFGAPPMEIVDEDD